jgi:hypothetical protein
MKRYTLSLPTRIKLRNSLLKLNGEGVGYAYNVRSNLPIMGVYDFKLTRCREYFDFNESWCYYFWIPNFMSPEDGWVIISNEQVRYNQEEMLSNFEEFLGLPNLKLNYV